MPPPVESNTETLSLWSFLADPIGFLSDVEHGGTHLILTLDGKPVGEIGRASCRERVFRTV